MKLPYSTFPLVRADVEAAQRALDYCASVTPRQFAALVWKWTELSTAPVCLRADGSILGIASNAIDAQRRVYEVEYYRVAHLCDCLNPWFPASEGQMLDWILLLEKERDRQMGWNYAHGFRTSDAPGELPERKKTGELLQRMTGIELPGFTLETSNVKPQTEEAKRAETEELRRIDAELKERAQRRQTESVDAFFAE
jgi:hypothetical protein